MRKTDREPAVTNANKQVKKEATKDKWITLQYAATGMTTKSSNIVSDTTSL